MEVLVEANNPSGTKFKVGEIFILEGLRAHHACLIVAILQHWAVHKAISEFPEQDEHTTTTAISYLAPSHASCPVIFLALNFSGTKADY